MKLSKIYKTQITQSHPLYELSQLFWVIPNFDDDDVINLFNNSIVPDGYYAALAPTEWGLQCEFFKPRQ